MKIINMFASILTLAGMALLIFACLVFMKGEGKLFGIEVDAIGTIPPLFLGIIFFGAGLFLLKYIVKSNGKS